MLAYDFLRAFRPSVFNYLRVDTPCNRKRIVGNLRMMHGNRLTYCTAVQCFVFCAAAACMLSGTYARHEPGMRT